MYEQHEGFRSLAENNKCFIHWGFATLTVLHVLRILGISGAYRDKLKQDTSLAICILAHYTAPVNGFGSDLKPRRTF
jgi:hypothetical protein